MRKSKTKRKSKICYVTRDGGDLYGASFVSIWFRRPQPETVIRYGNAVTTWPNFQSGCGMPTSMIAVQFRKLFGWFPEKGTISKMKIISPEIMDSERPIINVREKEKQGK